MPNACIKRINRFTHELGTDAFYHDCYVSSKESLNSAIISCLLEDDNFNGIQYNYMRDLLYFQTYQECTKLKFTDSFKKYDYNIPDEFNNQVELQIHSEYRNDAVSGGIKVAFDLRELLPIFRICYENFSYKNWNFKIYSCVGNAADSHMNIVISKSQFFFSFKFIEDRNLFILRLPDQSIIKNII